MATRGNRLLRQSLGVPGHCPARAGCSPGHCCPLGPVPMQHRSHSPRDAQGPAGPHPPLGAGSGRAGPCDGLVPVPAAPPCPPLPWQQRSSISVQHPFSSTHFPTPGPLSAHRLPACCGSGQPAEGGTPRPCHPSPLPPLVPATPHPGHPSPPATRRPSPPLALAGGVKGGAELIATNGNGKNKKK